MNTGIGDAVNLGWRLAAVLRSGDDKGLDDYNSERRLGAAKSELVSNLMTRAGLVRRPITRRARNLAVRTAGRVGVLDRHLAPALAQTALDYGEMAAPRRGPGRPAAGAALGAPTIGLAGRLARARPGRPDPAAPSRRRRPRGGPSPRHPAPRGPGGLPTPPAGPLVRCHGSASAPGRSRPTGPPLMEPYACRATPPPPSNHPERESMRALTVHEYGSPDVLTFTDQPGVAPSPVRSPSTSPTQASVLPT